MVQLGPAGSCPVRGLRPRPCKRVPPARARCAPRHIPRPRPASRRTPKTRSTRSLPARQVVQLLWTGSGRRMYRRPRHRPTGRWTHPADSSRAQSGRSVASRLSRVRHEVGLLHQQVTARIACQSTNRLRNELDRLEEITGFSRVGLERIGDRRRSRSTRATRHRFARSGSCSTNGLTT